MEFAFCHVPREHYASHVALVQHAEQLGFDRAWIPDQTFNHDPYSILAAIALSTSQIRLGVGVANPFTRHPSCSGRAIATVANMAPGRVSLGVGAGNVRELLEPLGFDFAAPAQRCREAIELIRQELTGEPVSYRGRHYQMLGVRLETGPVTVPLYLAGRGPRILEAAGAVADGVLIGGLCTEAGMRYALGCLRRGAERAGRAELPGDIVSWVTCWLTDDREARIEQLRPSIAHIIGGTPFEVMLQVGLPEATIAAIKEAYAKGGQTAAAPHVTSDCVDAFAIVGDVRTCITRIEELATYGATQFTFLMSSGGVAEHTARLDAIADQILPAFR